jgi:hypothetical protein
MQQLPQLTALLSLRHLQLYKTAPLLLEDMQKIGQLTQLTSLLLADQSYKPGVDAMLVVDINPLSSLTRLQSLGVAGICPRPPPAMPAPLAIGLCELDQLEEWDFGVTDALVAAAAAKRSSSGRTVALLVCPAA